MSDLHNDAVEFLALLRPGGPWVLTAIVPDGTIETITAKTADESARSSRSTMAAATFIIRSIRHERR